MPPGKSHWDFDRKCIKITISIFHINNQLAHNSLPITEICTEDRAASEDK